MLWPLADGTAVTRNGLPNGEEVDIRQRANGIARSTGRRNRMVLGRNGLRDERRRRVLMEETLHGGRRTLATTRQSPTLPPFARG